MGGEAHQHPGRRQPADPSRSESTWGLPWHPKAAFEARRHVTDACAGLPVETVDVARLLVSELVANAVRHGAGPLALSVGRHGPNLRVEVHDGSSTLPVVREVPRSVTDHGAGLRLVVALASTWGFTPSPGGDPGKSVWFTLS